MNSSPGRAPRARLGLSRQELVSDKPGPGQGPGGERPERPVQPPASSVGRKLGTYSRLIPDSGWGDILGWTTGGGWSIRFSSSISSLGGVRGGKQESQTFQESWNIPEGYCLMAGEGLYLE